ncbi:MAG TPA: HupE/UreJ family protein [Polyangia bacterium]
MKRAPMAMAAVLWLGAGGARALAHQQTTTFGAIAYPASGGDGADLTWRLRVRSVDLARLLGDRTPRGAEILRGGLHVAATVGAETRLCAPGAATLSPDPTAPEPTSVFVERFTCGPGARTLHLRYDLFFDHDPYHASYTRLALGDDATSDDPSASSIVFHNLAHEIAVDVHLPEPLWKSALTYLRLGVAHILTGYDHLAFLAALLLGAGLQARTRGATVAEAATPRQAIRGTIAVVSAFTVAHSLTLVTQVLRPGLLGTRWVEPAIAFSVAYVGFENLVPRAPRGRWLLVFGFGLVHGLGFASVLREIGLPRRGLLLSLLSFNLGVELGQLLVVGLALPIVVACARRSPRGFERWGAQIGSALIGLAGTIWLVTRIIGR